MTHLNRTSSLVTFTHVCAAHMTCRGPGATVADHAPGLIAALEHRFPDAKRLGCYPHISWKYGQGKLLSRTHARYQEIYEMLPELHTCHTPGMWDVLVECIKRMWETDDEELMKLWDSILAPPHNTWYVGACRTVGAMPSQQTQEVPTHTHQ